jgi:hypothetical protein
MDGVDGDSQIWWSTVEEGVDWAPPQPIADVANAGVALTAPPGGGPGPPDMEGGGRRSANLLEHHAANAGWSAQQTVAGGFSTFGPALACNPVGAAVLEQHGR